MIKMKDVDRIYWLRCGIGIIAGTVCGILSKLINGFGFEGITISLLFYLASYYIIKMVLKITPSPDDKTIPAKDKITPNNMFTKGIGTYVLLWLTVFIFILNFI